MREEKARFGHSVPYGPLFLAIAALLAAVLLAAAAHGLLSRTYGGLAQWF